MRAFGRNGTSGFSSSESAALDVRCGHRHRTLEPGKILIYNQILPRSYKIDHEPDRGNNIKKISIRRIRILRPYSWGDPNPIVPSQAGVMPEPT